jgi:hypothetical protein
VTFMARGTRGRVGCALIILVIAACPATCTYKLHTADEAERRCGDLANILRWDYSSELSNGVKFSADESDIRIDFTRLKNWNRVCLVSMYEDQINGSGQERRSDEPGFYQIGRWQCSDGNPVDAITVALIKSDGGTLARQIKIPGDIRGRLIGTDYGGNLQASLHDAGYRVCSEIDKAVARCAWRGEHPRRLCYLLFRAGTTSE